jgi:hypothetical protein
VSANFMGGHPVAATMARDMDNQLALLALLAHATFDRFPDLRFSLVHGHAAWVPLVLEKSEGYLTIAARHQIPVRIQAEDVWEERPVMVGVDADESAVHDLADDFAAKGIWGSRYPNEDTMTPAEALERFRAGGVADATIRRFLHDNGAQTYGIAVPVGA